MTIHSTKKTENDNKIDAGENKKIEPFAITPAWLINSKDLNDKRFRICCYLIQTYQMKNGLKDYNASELSSETNSDVNFIRREIKDFYLPTQILKVCGRKKIDKYWCILYSFNYLALRNHCKQTESFTAGLQPVNEPFTAGLQPVNETIVNIEQSNIIEKTKGLEPVRIPEAKGLEPVPEVIEISKVIEESVPSSGKNVNTYVNDTSQRESQHDTWYAEIALKHKVGTPAYKNACAELWREYPEFEPPKIYR